MVLSAIHASYYFLEQLTVAADSDASQYFVMVYSEKQKGRKLLTSTTNQTKMLPVSHFCDLVKFGEKSFLKSCSIFNAY